MCAVASQSLAGLWGKVCSTAFGDSCFLLAVVTAGRFTTSSKACSGQKPLAVPSTGPPSCTHPATPPEVWRLDKSHSLSPTTDPPSCTHPATPSSKQRKQNPLCTLQHCPCSCACSATPPAVWCLDKSRSLSLTQPFPFTDPPPCTRPAAPPAVWRLDESHRRRLPGALWAGRPGQHHGHGCGHQGGGEC